MGDSTTPPCWLRIWATEVTPGDLIRFRETGDAVRVIDRDYPPAYSPIFRIKLDEDTTTGLAKMARIWIFDPDGTVARRVQMVLPAEDRR